MGWTLRARDGFQQAEMRGGGVLGGGNHTCKGLEVGNESQPGLAGAGVHRERGWQEWKPPPTKRLLHAIYSLKAFPHNHPRRQVLSPPLFRGPI